MRQIGDRPKTEHPYIVCDAIGLDTSDYSFTYVAHWSDGEGELVKDTTESVTTCTTGILEALAGQSQDQRNVGVLPDIARELLRRLDLEENANARFT